MPHPQLPRGVPDRLPGEANKAWHAFHLWVTRGFESPTGRRPTLMDLSRELGHADSSTVYEWTCKHDWYERATAMDLASSAKVAAKAETLALRSLKVAEGLVGLVERELKRTIEAQELRLVDEPLSVTALAHLADKVITIQRLVEGQSTSNLAVRASVDLRGLSDGALEEIKKLTAKR